MDKLKQVRRVVIGVTDSGQSRIMSDGPIERIVGTVGLLWATDVGKSKLPGTSDPVAAIGKIFGPEGSTRLVASLVPPDSERDIKTRLSLSTGDLAPRNPSDQDGWHTTESVDYIIIMSGEVWCELDEGEVHLRAGDILIQTGTRHRWRNKTNETALMYSIPIGVPFRD
jgi:mannose-6-phosphate isomerase-like protein (cupin superfamily)